MTNVQFYLSLGVPGLLMLVTLIVNVTYFNSLQSQMNSLRSGLDLLTGKIIDLVDRISKLEAHP